MLLYFWYTIFFIYFVLLLFLWTTHFNVLREPCGLGFFRGRAQRSSESPDESRPDGGGGRALKTVLAIELSEDASWNQGSLHIYIYIYIHIYIYTFIIYTHL